MSRDPVAFMSYVRRDDRYGRLTQFRENLSEEVRLQTGEEFPIFQDRNDISWGENWKERIEESIDAVTFLIPVITPSFFNSTACRSELQRFIERETQLERNDLILPVYYVDAPLLNDERKRATDELAEVISTRQYADWRDLRFEPFTSPSVGNALARIASQVRNAIERAQRHGTSHRALVPKARNQPDESTESDTSDAARQLSGRTEPVNHTADPMGRGDFTTISAAIKAANPGDRILVRPGLYQEGLVIDKPLEIIGEGELEEIVVKSRGVSSLSFKTTMGRVANITFRQTGAASLSSIDVVQGRLELEGCDISSRNRACITIHGDADPRLRGNRIHGSRNSGVFVYNNGLGTLEDNDIFSNGYSGVTIKEGGDPALRRNRIRENTQSGVFVHENGLGTMEDNDIFANARGVTVKEGGDPTLRRNRIRENTQSGIFVHENGLGTMEDNDIVANEQAGVHIKTGGNPTLRHNRINNNSYEAVWVSNNGGGTIEGNDLQNNGLSGAWDISEDSEQNLKRVDNQE